MILFILSFIAGVLTVLAPCTLPLLPVIVGSSVGGGDNKRKALVISLSLGFSVIIFTLILKFSTAFISIPQVFWTNISGGIIILFGLISLFPKLWENIPFVSSLSTGSNKLLGVGYSKNSFWGDVIIGASLGPVFSTCSPTYFVVLATVLPQSLTAGLLDLFAYAFGLSGSLLLLSVLGQKIISKIGGISDTHGLFRRILGLVFIVLGFFIILGIDKKLEVKLLDLGFFDITKVEQKLLEINEQTKDQNTVLGESDKNIQGEQGEPAPVTKFIEKMHGPVAKEIVNPSGYINTDGKPITIGEFKGKKVVLLDIWTYSCINCQRTLPYLKAWYEKYKDQGLVVIGLHTPEFAFEKVKSNVESAVKRYGVTYPVVMDNDYSTWTAYGNQYWPRKYLISMDGEIVYDHIGEGKYEETEKAIQKALSELNSQDITDGVTKPVDAVAVSPAQVKSPEIYFGANRNEYLGNGVAGRMGEQELSLPQVFFANNLYLVGRWYFYPEYASSVGPGKILFKYSSKNVYMVASSEKGVNVEVYLDGKKVKDVNIKDNLLYSIIEGVDYSDHQLEIVVPASGLNVFTFTFG